MISLLIFTCLFCLLVITYVYIGYPITLWLLNLLGFAKTHQKKTFYPKVAMLICCYNEEDVINEKIDNCLLLDYPEEKLDLYFISDGSDDGTDEIIQSQVTDTVHYLRQEGRLGKTSALNMAIEQIESEIIVFSDANAIYQIDALIELVANFYDESVGYVVGAALYMDEGSNSSARSERSYWQYELAIKAMESKLHSVIGGDGAIYAIRKELYQPLEKQDINDFVNPLQIIELGYRGIFDSKAICYEYTSGNFKAEGNRKQRIVNRSIAGLWKMRKLLNPFKFGFYSIALLSHKLLRWLIPLFLLMVTFCIFTLSLMEFVIFQWLNILMLIFYCLALIGLYQSGHKKMSQIYHYPFYFMMVNYFSFIGIARFLMGDIQIIWSPARDTQSKDKNHISYYKVFASIFVLVLSLPLTFTVFSLISSW